MNKMKKIVLPYAAILMAGSVVAQPQMENLGAKVNSVYHEVRPTVSADGKTLYFVVEGNPKNTNYKSDKKAQDVWYSVLDDNGAWSQAVQSGAPINTQRDNAIFWVSPDGNRLLIRGAFENGQFTGRGLSLCTKNENGWSAPEKLNIDGYSKMSKDLYTGASMSNDGKTLILYFSEEKNSYLNDIYVSRLDEDNQRWSKPRKLGGSINMADYDEITPFMASDGVTLYFASDRPGGKGDYDIWMTRRTDDTWNNWSDPVNMGDSINSKNWDAYFSVDATGEYGYVSTTRNTIGGTDIARTKLSESQKPRSVVMVYGRIFNALTKEPMDAGLFYDAVPGETAEGNAVSSPGGSFKVTLPYGKKYSLRASADNYFSMLDTLDLTTSGPYKEIHRDLYLNPVVTDGKLMLDSNGNVIRTDLDSSELVDLKEGEILSTNNILFDFSKAILRPESYKELDKIARMLKANPNMQIELSAHTDGIGNYSKNLQLSDDRANSSRNYLISKGVSAGQIVAKGYGETTPVAPNTTEEGRQLNRRVEFRILKK